MKQLIKISNVLSFNVKTFLSCQLCLAKSIFLHSENLEELLGGTEIWEDEPGIGESFKEAGDAAVYLYSSGAQSSCRTYLQLCNPQSIMNPPLLNSDPIGADEIVKVAPSQGKGLGLFTTRSVAPGQLLVKEKPLVKVRMALIFIMMFPMLLLSKQPSLNCLMPRPR